MNRSPNAGVTKILLRGLLALGACVALKMGLGLDSVSWVAVVGAPIVLMVINQLFWYRSERR